MYPICLYVGEDPGLEKQNRLAHKCQPQLRDINEISGDEISIMFVGHDTHPTITERCPSPTAPGSDPPPRRPSLTRSGSVRYHDGAVSPEGGDKPSGKRKFKSKHLCDNGDQKVRLLFFCVFMYGCLKARGISLPIY